jgi:hypothetical protein
MTIQRRMQKVSHVHRKRRSPGFGVTLDGVKRPLGHTRASSEAGTRRRHGRWNQPTESRRITRRVFLAPALLMHER